MTAGWRARVDRFWATELGVDVAAFARPGVQVLEGTRDDADARVVVVSTTDTTVVSVTRDDQRRFEDAGLRFEAWDAAPRAAVPALAQTGALDVRGPAYLGCWTRATVPAGSREARQVDRARERTAVDALRATAPDEWDEAGLDAGSIVFGARENERLVAVAGYERWADLAHLQVFTHPRHRRRGLARDVLAAALRHALAAGLLPQYRARDTNVASRVVADRMGFEEYGWMATVRLR